MSDVKYLFKDLIMYSSNQYGITYIEKDLVDEDCYISICPPMDMSKKMEEYLAANARCDFCKSPIKTLARCKCGGAIPAPEFITVVIDTSPMFEVIFNQQQIANKYKRKSQNRKSKLANAGTYSPEEIISLLEVQRGGCYYCATGLLDDQGNKIYHVDHYVSLLDGGRNEIHNIVLACPDCNLKKGTTEAVSFTRQRSRSLNADTRKKANEIRAKVRAYKKAKNLIASKTVTFPHHAQ